MYQYLKKTQTNKSGSQQSINFLQSAQLNKDVGGSNCQ